ncbi:hypothetical protein RJ639_016352 [Escallonia herrerae]|uniref:pyridoxal 5'-phosphate synthase (glutamine hydrolyzing) n=1 Tax=Escallonia herrerae TaxID=1293975 RepID=A0AA88VC84_9ASTE|nr:hypothetical protein RJ639_016352 [Escallonia herrerae]
MGLSRVFRIFILQCFGQRSAVITWALCKIHTKQLGRLPVVHFAAGRLATLEDAALMMELGCDVVFVDSDVFTSGDLVRRGRAIVQDVHYSDMKD